MLNSTVCDMNESYVNRLVTGLIFQSTKFSRRRKNRFVNKLKNNNKKITKSGRARDRTANKSEAITGKEGKCDAVPNLERFYCPAPSASHVTQTSLDCSSITVRLACFRRSVSKKERNGQRRRGKKRLRFGTGSVKFFMRLDPYLPRCFVPLLFRCLLFSSESLDLATVRSTVTLGTV